MTAKIAKTIQIVLFTVIEHAIKSWNNRDEPSSLSKICCQEKIFSGFE